MLGMKSRSASVSEHTQRVSSGVVKCKRMFGHLALPDAFDKYLTWAASSGACPDLAKTELTLY